MAFDDSGRHPQWPKVADAVIEAHDTVGERKSTEIFGCVPPSTHVVFARGVQLTMSTVLREPRDVNPTRLLRQLAVLPSWEGCRSCSWPIGEATWP